MKTPFILRHSLMLSLVMVMVCACPFLSMGQGMGDQSTITTVRDTIADTIWNRFYAMTDSLVLVLKVKQYPNQPPGSQNKAFFETEDAEFPFKVEIYRCDSLPEGHWGMGIQETCLRERRYLNGRGKLVVQKFYFPRYVIERKRLLGRIWTRRRIESLYGTPWSI